jgi:hypothetical protein
MTTVTKYRATKTLSFIGIPITLWILSKIQTYALAGETANAKKWFVILLIFVAFELAVTIAFYYYRSAIKHKNPDAIAVETLAKLRNIEWKQ